MERGLQVEPNTAYTDAARPDAAPVALIGITAYVILRGDGGNLAVNMDCYPATDNPDEYADAVLASLALPESLAASWHHSGGDDHGDGLTSYSYVLPVYSMDTVRAAVEWATGYPEDPWQGATENMGIIIGYAYGIDAHMIPDGVTYSMDGMQWNVGGITAVAGSELSVWPVSMDAARYYGWGDSE